MPTQESAPPHITRPMPPNAQPLMRETLTRNSPSLLSEDSALAEKTPRNASIDYRPCFRSCAIISASASGSGRSWLFSLARIHGPNAADRQVEDVACSEIAQGTDVELAKRLIRQMLGEILQIGRSARWRRPIAREHVQFLRSKARVFVTRMASGNVPDRAMRTMGILLVPVVGNGNARAHNARALEPAMAEIGDHPQQQTSH